ncbi:Flavin monooxygenase-like protein [Niveomyces insectorum RCEF 264]|uniref:Flavin monooxygenase-like protein n=1 Tax=Niveomyces insectorum RCEF 264 TaxID=1081102 RepID=A0A168AEB7_9HYPO|nr:Flavin monooxygenase-like protein [Niveomyces insectorum RCEF 264]
MALLADPSNEAGTALPVIDGPGAKTANGTSAKMAGVNGAGAEAGDGHGHGHGNTPADAAAALDPNYTIIEEPINTRRPIRVACLGAGYSGLMMGIVVSQRMQNANVEFVIYERNPDIGGTWLENRYPGCKCDIPAHNYAFSFCPKADWPNYYATAPQIYAYMKDVAAKYDVNKYIKFRHAIRSATWNEATGKWEIQVEAGDGSTFLDKCDVFINAGGVLNNWKLPAIPGLDSFKGKLVHTARWDTSYDFTGKRVASIGIGSSGIQIVPQLAKVVRSMDVHVRSKTWISPAPGINEPTANDPEMDDQYNFSQATLDQFKDPIALRDYRMAIMDRRIDNFKRALADSDIQVKAQELFRQSMRERLGDSEKGRRAADVLLPDYPVGCRRQTPGPGFLEALVQDNVELLWDDIDCITAKGIRTKSGEDKEYDAIVCATGFDTTFRPPFPLIGRNGVNLAERWDADRPKAYFGVAVPDFPNYFCFIGPNSPISNGSLVLSIQATAIYIYKWLNKLQTEAIRSVCVRHDANEEYNQHMQKFLERTVWTRGCRSWYKRGTVDGPVVAIYGGTTFHFMEALKNPRWEDFVMDRVPAAAANRFAYLGNGFTLSETKASSVGATQTLDFDEYWNLFVLPEIHD